MHRFPHTLLIDGMEYPIRTSYRVVWQWLKLMDEPILDAEYKLNGTLYLFFYDDPPSLSASYEAVMQFLRCGRPEMTEGDEKKTYDFEQDYLWIRSGFLTQYGIDLNCDLSMHWWDFKSRFDELKSDTMIKQIIQLREMPLPNMEDSSYWDVVKAKERFALS